MDDNLTLNWPRRGVPPKPDHDVNSPAARQPALWSGHADLAILTEKRLLYNVGKTLQPIGITVGQLPFKPWIIIASYGRQLRLGVFITGGTVRTGYHGTADPVDWPGRTTTQLALAEPQTD